jgi:undecaprenyl-diphosphatase
MSLFNIVVLAIIQGLAELLPVSSSAHVVVAEKLLGLDPSSPPMTLLLVMLHTGTMFAVIVYFWRTWRGTYFQSLPAFKKFAAQVIIATLLTGIVGGALTLLIEKTVFAGLPEGADRGSVRTSGTHRAGIGGCWNTDSGGGPGDTPAQQRLGLRG